jgi:hypothetical protein
MRLKPLGFGKMAAIRFQISALVLALSASAVWGLPTVLNNSFELPDIGTGSSAYVESTAPTDWYDLTPISGQGGGYVGNGSSFGNTDAPDGTQALFLNGTGGTAQQLSGFIANQFYTISFYAEGAPNASDNIEVQIGDASGMVIVPVTFDNGNVYRWNPSSGSYTFYTSDPFRVTTSTPTIEFEGLGPIADSSFIDDVSFVPEPASMGIVALIVLGASRRRV